MHFFLNIYKNNCRINTKDIIKLSELFYSVFFCIFAYMKIANSKINNISDSFWSSEFQEIGTDNNFHKMMHEKWGKYITIISANVDIIIGVDIDYVSNVWEYDSDGYPRAYKILKICNI